MCGIVVLGWGSQNMHLYLVPPPGPSLVHHGPPLLHRKERHTKL